MGALIVRAVSAALLVLTVFAAVTPAGAQTPAALAPGCTAETPPAAVASPAALLSAIRPAGAVRALWQHDPATGRFAAYFPDSPAASDLQALTAEAVWICVDAPAQLVQPAAAAAPALRCVAMPLPVSRSAAQWNVACTLTGAGSGETSFSVAAFATNGRHLCDADLTGGSGSCAGTLTVTLDEAPMPLQFFATISPDAAVVADLSPDVRPLRGPGGPAPASLDLHRASRGSAG
jgi:hypothetical protein